MGIPRGLYIDFTFESVLLSHNKWVNPVLLIFVSIALKIISADHNLCRFLLYTNAKALNNNVLFNFEKKY